MVSLLRVVVSLLRVVISLLRVTETSTTQKFLMTVVCVDESVSIELDLVAVFCIENFSYCRYGKQLSEVE